jgi:MYXO-CTERM domain-containing protein
LKRALLCAAVLLFAPAARAYCPSYTPADTAGGQNCGVQPAPGTNPDIAAWQQIFSVVAPGEASWGTSGPSIGTIGSGCGKPNPTTQVPAHFPCHVLQAIAMVESGWRQFCVPDTPSNEVGQPSRTIVSFDCGYGVGQVTSGMHVGETPSFDRNRVASDPTYNLATGTLILRDKWVATNCVGDNDPDIVEDWYTAIWAYNGLSYSNNPNNPNLTPGRGVYNPSVGGSYTYQEKVYGWMEHPPSDGRWSVLAAAYPNRTEIGTSGSPPNLSEPACASPTDCTKTRSTHHSACAGVTSDAGAPDASSSSDAAIANDAAQEPDAGTTPPETSGCSCHVTSTRRSPIALGAIAIAILALVRRRRFR